MNSSLLTKTSLILSLFAAPLFSVMEVQTAPYDQCMMNRDTAALCYADAPCCMDMASPFDFYATGSFIYWQPIQENMNLGVISDSSGTTDLVNGKEVGVNWKYQPGFQLGIGMDDACGQWGSYIEYTWFEAKESVKKNLDINNAAINLLPARQIPDFLNPQYKYGAEKWTLKMNLIDWDISKRYAICEQLSLRPFVGLRGAFIDQSIHVEYLNFTEDYLAIWPSTFTHQQSHSWGVGPRVGLYSEYNLGDGFRLYAEEEVDLLYTQYKLKSHQYSAIAFPSQYIVKQKNADYLRTHLQIDLGFGWSTFCGNDGYHIDLSADYNFQAFYDQNMFRSISSTQAVGKSTLPNGNLYIHGLTASVRIDF